MAPRLVARVPVNQERAGDKDGRIGSNQDAYQQGKRKIMNNLPTKEEQGDNHHQRCSGSEQCPAQCLVDTGIDNLNKRVFSPATKVLPDAVKNDNGIVQGVTDNG